MDQAKLLNEISRKNFDRDYFVNLVNRNKNVRNTIVCELISNPNIMVYYHCYYVVSDASNKEPALYYEYWDKFAKLLDHDNSYHRDIGLTMIANLVQVDYENRLSLIWSKYTEHLCDEKFMTGKCCLHNLKIILKTRSDLIDEVTTILLSIDKICPYTEKQKALLVCSILDIFDDVYLKSGKKEEIMCFIERASKSISPKTKKRAKQLIKKYRI